MYLCIAIGNCGATDGCSSAKAKLNCLHRNNARPTANGIRDLSSTSNGKKRDVTTRSSSSQSINQTQNKYGYKENFYGDQSPHE